MKHLIVLTAMVGLLAPAIMYGSDRDAVLRNPGKDLPPSYQRVQDSLDQEQKRLDARTAGSQVQQQRRQARQQRFADLRSSATQNMRGAAQRGVQFGDSAVTQAQEMGDSLKARFADLRSSATQNMRGAAQRGVQFGDSAVTQAQEMGDSLKARFADLRSSATQNMRGAAQRGVQFGDSAVTQAQEMGDSLKAWYNRPSARALQEQAEIYEQNAPSTVYSTLPQHRTVYEKLPERTWYDYLTQKEGGFRTDVSRLGEQGKAQFARIPSYMGSMRDYVWSGAKDLKDDLKNKEYDRYFGKQRVRDYTRAYYPRTPSAPLSRADDYEKAYSEKNQPRYGNRAWELEQAYNVPYAERIRSRMPNMPNVGQYMPDSETPARMWSNVSSAPDLGISRRASELYQGLPSGKSVGSYFTRKPAMAPMPSAANIERRNEVESLEQWR